MSKYRQLVDIDAVLIAYFKTVAPITTITSTRISTDLPADFGKQAATNRRLQLGRGGGSQINSAVDRPLVDFWIYGNTRTEAWELVKVTDLAVQEIVEADLAGAVVTEVERISGPVYSPDQDTDIPRYLTTWAMVTHSRPI